MSKKMMLKRRGTRTLYGKNIIIIIIIEGPCITRKTELASLIASNFNATLISAEWYIFHEPYQPYIGPTLINIIPSYAGIINGTYYYLARIMQVFRYQHFVLDRFHISAQFFQKKFRNYEIDFSWLEDMLIPLDARIVLCTRNPETYEDALQRRLSQSTHPELYPSNAEEFRKDQEIYRELVRKSRLKSFEVDVTHGNLEQIIQKISRWIENED